MEPKFTRKFFVICTLALLLFCGNSGCLHDDDDDDDHFYDYVTTPDTPDGQNTAKVGDLITFSSGGSHCTAGHSVQYRFSFDDGAYSDWSYSQSASHVYNFSGFYFVQAQARCFYSYDRSYWSNGHWIDISTKGPRDTELAYRAAWGDDKGNVWFVGARGMSVRFDPKGRIAGARPARKTLYGICGRDAQQIYCCGAAGTVIHYDGESWKSLAAPTSKDLYAITLWDEKRLLSSGAQGTLLQLNDNGVQLIPCPVKQNLRGIWALNHYNVFIVGDNGTILHYDGQRITRQTSPTAKNLHSIWGSGIQNIWAVGAQGTVLHYDGISWKARENLAMDLYCVYGVTPSEIYITGAQGNIYRPRRQGYDKIESGLPQHLYAIWLRAQDRHIRVGGASQALHKIELP